MEIKYTKTAVKVINSLDKAMKLKIKNGIEGLTEAPPKGDIKQLQGYDPSLYRLRIGKYRILYEYTIIDNKQALIIKDIGSRGDIYK
ncbi:MULTISPECIES: type II toxin-antitoxin system RelE/ParE family toxin [unclassified Dehalobacter]|uniref:type II toxin-antitoxin system RelE family toxin n=1 Tax=unclassified Dehalobacter TaxID=2635733 RepID=UPI00104E157A|nr:MULTISPECIES: type II toxin-antitoxin system RelE/ParE family toxin [unclassified Dehalobacter]TCX51906.1 plasmid stabilization protein [Dehalobacter sp. 14DCB1]TCX52966.1 plasmid stabilization protein [Dehalobacter sp. 12DCB1]